MKKKNAKVIAMANQKGGVGKTTHTVNLPAALAKKGKKVLIVDLDIQGNMSLYALPSFRSVSEQESGIANVILDGIDIRSVIEHANGLDIIPASEKLVTTNENIYRIDFAAAKEIYDYIFLDCPPTIGGNSLTGITSADKVIIPAKYDIFSLQGFTEVIKSIQTMQAEIDGVIIADYSLNTRIAKNMQDDFQAICDATGVYLYDSKIRSSVTVKESQSAQMPVVDFDKTSVVAEEYLKLADEFIKRNK